MKFPTDYVNPGADKSLTCSTNYGLSNPTAIRCVFETASFRIKVDQAFPNSLRSISIIVSGIINPGIAKRT